MKAQMLAYKGRGVTHLAFGDIFLEDLKRWREENLARVGLRGVFPIWKGDSRELIHEFITLGFGSIICCVSDAYLDETALGRKIDADFLQWLPAGRGPLRRKWRVPFLCFRRADFQAADPSQGRRKSLSPGRGNPSGRSATVVQRPAHAAPKDFGFVICCPLRELKPTQKKI